MFLPNFVYILIMRNEKIIRRAFNAGEVSKRFKHRNDVEKHAYSCEKLENFYVSPLGAISRRKGTQLIGSLGSTDKDDTVRLVPFEYNRDLSYLLVFHSADVEKETFVCKSDEFSLSDEFSICFTIPKYDTYFDVLKKSDLIISLFTDSSMTIYCGAYAEHIPIKEGDKITLTYNKNATPFWKLFINGDNDNSVDSLCYYNDKRDSLVLSSRQKGDMLGLKLFAFDMSKENAYYTPADYSNGKSEDISSVLKESDYRVFRCNHNVNDEEMLIDTLECLKANIIPKLRGELQEGSGVVYEISPTIKDISEFSEYLKYDSECSAFDLYVKKSEVPSVDNFQPQYTDADGEVWVKYVGKPSSISWDENNKITVHNGVKFQASDELWEGLVSDANNYSALWNSTDLAEQARAHQYAIEGYKKAFKMFGFECVLNDILTYNPEDITGKREEVMPDASDEEWEEYANEIINGKLHLYLQNILSSLCGIGQFKSNCDYSSFSTYDINGFADFKNSPMPLAYDFIVVPFKIPVGTSIDDFKKQVEGPQCIFPNASSGVSVYGLSGDYNQVDDKLDGTHTFNIEYIVFAVPIANCAGESTYSDTIKTTLKVSNVLLDKDLKWSSTKVVKLDACDVSGNYICKDIDTQIPVDALHEFQYKQAGAYVYLAHSLFKPTLLKFDGKTFIVEDAVKFEPSKTEWESDLVIKLDNSDKSDTCYTDETVTITSNKDFFDTSMLDMQLKLEYKDERVREYKWAHTTSTNPTGNTTPAFALCGEICVRLEGGIWDGVLVLEESTDNGKTWNEIARTTSIEGSSNSEIIREIYDPTSLVRVRMAESNYCSVGSGEQIYDYKRGCFFQVIIKGTTAVWGKIVGVESPRKAWLKLISPCRSKFTTKYVYRSAWGAGFGYPRTVDIHEERLTLAGTQKNPATVWLSQTNNWDNFRSVSNLETDPLSYNLASDDGEPISWLVSREDLMIGLGSSEWSLGSRESGEALTQSIVKASDQSSDGVEYIMPVKVGGMVVYVRRGNREIASMSYDFANDSYNSISLTTMNPEILGGGAVNIFNQLSPRNNLFVLRKDGILAVFTFDKENNVMAWSRFTFGEGVVSACSLSTGIFRSIFMVVRRNGIMCIERLDANESETDNWLDCVPINSDITIPDGLKTSVNYTSIVKTTPIFTDLIANVHSLRVYLVDSYGGEYRVVGYNENGDAVEPEFREIQPRENEIFDTSNKVRDYRFSGVVRSGNLEEASIELRTNKPAPFEITAIGADIRG